MAFACMETTQDRFAFAMDNKRAVFDNIFSIAAHLVVARCAGQYQMVFHYRYLPAIAYDSSFGHLYFLYHQQKSERPCYVKSTA